MTEPDRQYRIAALAKGLAVLRLFDENVTELHLREICDRTGIPMPTAYRIVATLEQEGFIEKLPDGSVRPGVAVLTLGSSTLRGSSVVQASELPLRQLAQVTGETVNLGVLLGSQVLYLVRIRNSDIVTANLQVGSTLPAAATSMGKLLMAYLSPQELASRLSTMEFPVTSAPNAIATRADLETRLRQIRTGGFAIQDEELAQGLRSVAAPVFGSTGRPIAAVNIAVSSAGRTVTELRGPLLEQLQYAADRISSSLRAR